MKNCISNAKLISNCFGVTIPLLVQPVSLGSLIALSFRCYQQQKTAQYAPLLFTQFNSLLVWSFLLFYELIYFKSKIDAIGYKGSQNDIENERQQIILTFLKKLVLLEPQSFLVHIQVFKRDTSKKQENYSKKNIGRDLALGDLRCASKILRSHCWLLRNRWNKDL